MRPNALQFHADETARAAREAHRILMRGDITELYVWFEPWKFLVSTNKPSEVAQLAFPERVPGHLTADQLVMWFAARTSRVPYLVGEPT